MKCPCHLFYTQIIKSCTLNIKPGVELAFSSSLFWTHSSTSYSFRRLLKMHRLYLISLNYLLNNWYWVNIFISYLKITLPAFLPFFISLSTVMMQDHINFILCTEALLCVMASFWLMIQLVFNTTNVLESCWWCDVWKMALDVNFPNALTAEGLHHTTSS